MAISSFGRGKGEDEMAASPAASSGASANLTAFIDQGSEFEGKLTFKDTVRIDGTFSGEITSENTLIVGETGSIEATIRSNTVVVSGSVVGNIVAARQIVLHKSAKVQGDMSAPSLMIEEGAIFNGQLSMGRPDAKGGAASPLKSIDGGAKEGDPHKNQQNQQNQPK
jgi:cytoskeletal protein CcmA (bactofilin family)